MGGYILKWRQAIILLVLCSFCMFSWLEETTNQSNTVFIVHILTKWKESGLTLALPSLVFFPAASAQALPMLLLLAWCCSRPPSPPFLLLLFFLLFLTSHSWCPGTLACLHSPFFASAFFHFLPVFLSLHASFSSFSSSSHTKKMKIKPKSFYSFYCQAVWLNSVYILTAVLHHDMK